MARPITRIATFTGASSSAEIFNVHSARTTEIQMTETVVPVASLAIRGAAVARQRMGVL